MGLCVIRVLQSSTSSHKLSVRPIKSKIIFKNTRYWLYNIFFDGCRRKYRLYMGFEQGSNHHIARVFFLYFP